jgi:hypothetical protein
VIGVLLKAGKKEPNGLARCIALSSLGIFVYRELAHETFHPKLKDAIFVLLAALKFNNKAVAQVTMSCSFLDLILETSFICSVADPDPQGFVYFCRIWI